MDTKVKYFQVCGVTDPTFVYIVADSFESFKAKAMVRFQTEGKSGSIGVYNFATRTKMECNDIFFLLPETEKFDYENFDQPATIASFEMGEQILPLKETQNKPFWKAFFHGLFKPTYKNKSE